MLSSNCDKSGITLNVIVFLMQNPTPPPLLAGQVWKRIPQSGCRSRESGSGITKFYNWNTGTTQLTTVLVQEGEERGGGLHEAAHEAGQGESLGGKLLSVRMLPGFEYRFTAKNIMNLL